MNMWIYSKTPENKKCLQNLRKKLLLIIMRLLLTKLPNARLPKKNKKVHCRRNITQFAELPGDP